MTKTLTVTLPEDLTLALDEFARREGLAADQVVGQAIKEHIFLRRFRLLRERLAARVPGEEPLTDDDVFDRVS